MTYEVSAAEKPPRTTLIFAGIRVDTHGGDGESRRRRADVPLSRSLSHLSHFDGLNVRIAPRRAGGDAGRFTPAHRRACPCKGGSSAAVLPPPKRRTPLFARHSCRFATQNTAPGRFEGPHFWRFAWKGLLRYTPTDLLRRWRDDVRCHGYSLGADSLCRGLLTKESCRALEVY